MELGTPTKEELDKLLDLLSDYKRRQDLHNRYDEALRKHGHDLIWAAIDKYRIIEDAEKLFELWDLCKGKTISKEFKNAMKEFRGRILYSKFPVANLPVARIDEI